MHPAIRLIALVLSLTLAPNISCGFARAQDRTSPFGTGVWTVIIPDAFPNFIYSWRFKPDGTYREDGRDARTGKPVQETLSGHWTVDNAHVSLRQKDQPFVFEGILVQDRLSGTLYFNGRNYSRFCAVKGETAPKTCSEEGVASSASPGRNNRS
jgi:hypothetical protein